MTLARPENRVLGANTSDTRSIPEWLPRRQAAEVSGYSLPRLDQLFRELPTRDGPRVSRSGARVVKYIHMPSLLRHQESVTRWNMTGVPHPNVTKNFTKLGRMLRDERVARGWTQDMVCEALGTNQTQVSSWEGGLSVPQVRFIVKLCELYDLPLQRRWAMVEALAWLQTERKRGS
jgi:DNA-binding XRE family transcriptional regulator